MDRVRVDLSPVTPREPRPERPASPVARERATGSSGTASGATGHGTARERLLAAAARLFAAHGSDAVTIREIAAAAGVRHGGVNYHFRSKRELYLEVLARHAPPGIDLAGQGDPVVRAALEARTPAEARTHLAALVRALVQRMTHPPSTVGLGLMHQEMRRPDGPDDAIFYNVIEPQSRALAHVVSILAPSIQDEQELRLRALEIKAQCLIFRFARPVVERLLEVETFDAAWVERITTSIVNTTLTGLDETRTETDR
jgi:AcrR family transcriptional regulator